MIYAGYTLNEKSDEQYNSGLCGGSYKSNIYPEIK